jgi:AraC family ethanolamine operon transcriptional activator
MDEIAPATSTVLVKAFSSADDFQSIEHMNVDFTPLQLKISASYVTLSLPGCDLSLLHSFPRILDGSVKHGCTLIGFVMDEGTPLKFNGVDRDQAIIVIGSSGAEYSLIERTSRQLAVIIFHPEIEGRGWPVARTSVGMFETSLLAYRRLQKVVSEIILTAQASLDAAWRDASSFAVRETLLAAIDAAFADVASIEQTAQAQMARQYRVFRAIESAIASDLGGPIYSEALAERVGVSVRTLHNAIQRYRGMSLHQYLRLRRLWLVRQGLLSGAASVKDAALVFGFWHLGDFARGYRDQFGELPSETLARAR